MTEKVLVTGGYGRLGMEIQKLKPDYLYPTKAQMDFTKPFEIEHYFNTHNPTRVIHLGALTSVVSCQQNHKLAWQTNVVGTKNIVHICREYGIPLTYMSTPCVFDGESAPYNEADIPNPKNFYGYTKAVGEQIVGTLDEYQIIRANFVPKGKWPYMGAYVDRLGTYLYAHDVVWWILNLGIKSPIVHICGDKRMSMFELAKLTTPNVEPITMEEGSFLTRDMTLTSCVTNKRFKLDGIKL